MKSILIGLFTFPVLLFSILLCSTDLFTFATSDLWPVLMDPDCSYNAGIINAMTSTKEFEVACSIPCRSPAQTYGHPAKRYTSSVRGSTGEYRGDELGDIPGADPVDPQ